MAFGYGQDPKLLETFEYPSHASVLSKHSGYVWDAVVDIDRTAGERVAQHHGVKVFSSPGEIDSADGYDCVVLAIPPAARLDWLAALPNLKAVLVEKPLGNSLDEAERFASTCRERGIVVQVNLLRRFCSEMNALAAGLNWDLGDIQGATLVYGNGLRNNGTHMIDLVRQLLGEIAEIVPIGRSVASRGPLPGDVEATFALITSTGKPVFGMPVDFASYRENGLDLWGTRGRILLWQETMKMTRVPRIDSRTTTGAGELAVDHSETIATDLGRSLWRAYDDLADAVETGGAVLSPIESALATSRVVESVIAATQGGPH
ncbi:MAG: Gfo/Idh/MocA family oxidoreductase [Hyphomicrobium sp.]|nr:Gfo/Idh/MocA family oxidoreductase [Hyphomicrobium sp.]